MLERTLRDFKFELPSSGIRHFELDTETVASPKDRLTKLLFENSDLVKKSLIDDLKKFETNFSKSSGFEIEFTNDAQNALIEKSIQSDKSISTICNELFKDFKHGLAIVARNSNDKKWELTKDAVDNPDKYLSELVVKSFNKK